MDFENKFYRLVAERLSKSLSEERKNIYRIGLPNYLKLCIIIMDFCS